MYNSLYNINSPTKMKITTTSISCITALTSTVFANIGDISIYTPDYSQVDLSSFNLTGINTYNLPFSLTSGNALPGVGSSFTVGVTMTALTNGFSWNAPANSSQINFSVAGPWLPGSALSTSSMISYANIPAISGFDLTTDGISFGGSSNGTSNPTQYQYGWLRNAASIANASYSGGVTLEWDLANGTGVGTNSASYGAKSNSISFTQVPEPSSTSLLLLGAICLLRRKRA